VGIDKSKSGKIKIWTTDGAIDEVRKINQVDGNTYPDEEFPKNARLLRGFDWREDERPKSIEDLFKDDPPLILPIIKGLEDYVPQEEFFDDKLLERVEASDKEAEISKKENKAARNIPKHLLEEKMKRKREKLKKTQKEN
jgi:hypothetical protein